VDERPAIMVEEKNAFWKWALLHFKQNYERKFSTKCVGVMKEGVLQKWKLYRDADQNLNEELNQREKASQFITQ